MLLCGLWAMGPDIPRFFAYIFRLKYSYNTEAHQPGWPDIFFFHGTLDKHKRGGSLPATIIIVFMFACLFYMYIKYIIELRNEIKRLKSL